jgi:hypothetical protein
MESGRLTIFARIKLVNTLIELTETSREINLSINSEIAVYPSGDRRSGAAAGLG